MRDFPPDVEEVVDERAPWMREAAFLLGHDVREFDEGGRRLLGLIRRIDVRTPISIAWCGLFLAHCLRKARPDLEFPLDQPQGRPWRKFGEPCEPQFGAVLVFWRFASWAPFGHAGFYWAEDDDCYHVLGGNQHDRITIGRTPKRRLLAARWPEGEPRTGLRRMRPPEEATGAERPARA